MASRSPYNRFLSGFVEPLVWGGHVQVDGLLGPGALKEFLADPNPDATVLARIGKGMHDRLARLGSVGAADHVPPDAIALLAAWYNLLAMTHPEAKSARLRRTVRAWTSALLDWCHTPQTRAEVSLRHGLLARLGELGRVDTHVEFWAGYADFVGVAPPRSLVALPRVRRVSESRVRVDLLSLLRSLEPGTADDPDSDLIPVARLALCLSPLTDLCLADRPAPFTFVWTPPTVEAVGDASLRGAAQRALLARGTPAVRAVEQATLSLAKTAPSAKIARALARFHLELVALDAIAGRGPGQAPVAQPLGLDALLRLGYARTAELVGISEETLLRALPPDPNRPTPKDPPSGPLLAASGLLET